MPTKEFTAELYLRWFQFGAFCTLFRSHGRTWKLRLPWGWNTGEPGPIEINNYNGAAVPDASQLHNPQVEPICRKYLELRYRMLPYLYSAVRECATTAMPVMRALWLHYPDDPKAVARGDQYLWGREPAGRAGSRERAPLPAKSICRAATGTISGPASAWREAAKSAARWTSRLCRCMSAPELDSAARPGETIHGESRRTSRSRFRSIPEPMLPSCSTKTTAARSTTARANGWASR